MSNTKVEIDKLYTRGIKGYLQLVSDYDTETIRMFRIGWQISIATENVEELQAMRKLLFDD